jgi:hypothetical protein
MKRVTLALSPGVALPKWWMWWTCGGLPTTAPPRLKSGAVGGCGGCGGLLEYERERFMYVYMLRVKGGR